jgi:hypothetical protein
VAKRGKVFPRSASPTPLRLRVVAYLEFSTKAPVMRICNNIPANFIRCLIFRPIAYFLCRPVFGTLSPPMQLGPESLFFLPHACHRTKI